MVPFQVNKRSEMIIAELNKPLNDDLSRCRKDGRKSAKAAFAFCDIFPMNQAKVLNYCIGMNDRFFVNIEFGSWYGSSPFEAEAEIEKFAHAIDFRGFAAEGKNTFSICPRGPDLPLPPRPDRDQSNP